MNLQNAIADMFDTEFLSPATNVPSFPISGRMYGVNDRLVVSVIVTKRSKALNVFFIVDTGSPYTFLSATTLSNLGYNDAIPTEAYVNVHSIPLMVHRSVNHYSDVNVIGADFMRTAGCQLIANYTTKTLTIEKV